MCVIIILYLCYHICRRTFSSGGCETKVEIPGMQRGVEQSPFSRDLLLKFDPGPVRLLSPGKFLEMQNLKPYSRPTKV